MEILFFCQVEYSPVHGLSLIISDISPEFTLGNMLIEKQKTIEKLVEIGIFNQNRTLVFPRLPKRIAIISVDTSKGFQDFRNVIDSSHKFGISYFLFPAILQGDNAINSIQDQLLNILKVQHHFDAIAIIRGGGGDVGLSCYDDFELSRFVANFPLPVMTGIGHSTNKTVVEMVSFQSFITPTELAYFLLGRFEFEHQLIMHLSAKIRDEFLEILDIENQNIDQMISKLENQSTHFLFQQHSKYKELSFSLTNSVRLQKQISISELSNIKQRISFSSKFFFDKKLIYTDFISEKLKLVDPNQIMKRGYSITISEGKIVKSIKDIEKGGKLRTLVLDGEIESEVTQIIEKL
jgi:exodeoxyribonuclease VII large subunit